MKKKLIDKERGFTSVDVTIAMLVIIVFVSISASLLHSTYLSTTEAKRTAVALNYAVEIFERVGAMKYSEVSNEPESQLKMKGDIDSKYFDKEEVHITVSEMYPGQIKQVNLTIVYVISGRRETQSIDMIRIKINEEL